MNSEGEKLKDTGIQLSIFNAESKSPGWKGRALDYLLRYLRAYPDQRFQTEDVRAFAYRQGLSFPPNERAWGAVIVSAKRLGLIRFAGYEAVDNPLAHRTPASVWERGENANL